MHIFNLVFFLLAVGLDAAHNVEDAGSLTTSIAGLEQLLATEDFLINNLDNYAKELEQKLLVIRSMITSLREENDKGRKNPEYYLSIPTNVFALVRRLYKDWVYLDAYMKKSVGEGQIKTLREHWLELPKDDDFVEAVKAMSLMQDIYDLKAQDLAKGLINGQQYDTKLTALDCYALGYELFSQKDYINAGFWLYIAIHLHEENVMTGLHDLSQSKIMELYAETLLRQGRHQDALSALEALLSLPLLAPPDSHVIQKKNELELHIRINNPQPPRHIKEEPNLHQRSCRGEFSSRSSTLYCLYNTTTTAFLKLAPLKMEIISFDPYMVLFHDVMSDEEILTLQKIARPNLRRAKLYSVDRQREEVAAGRTSKIAWFARSTNAVTERINKRIEDMTGFNLTDSEPLEVMNYGLGGHIEAHYDFFDVSMTTDVVAGSGDRKATVLFYMTDVEQGGVTVFPNIETAIFPKKGTAVMWYNLNDRREPDYKTLHSGCPVLVGSKWVATQWICEGSQMFKLPCHKQR